MALQKLLTVAIKSKKTCDKGYDLLEKLHLNDFVHREMTFKCK